jgi:biopolymer transport protein ExbB
VITAVFVVAILLALWRFVVLMGMSTKVTAQLKAKTADVTNPLGRVLKVAGDNPGLDPESLELKLHEAVLKERPEIESGLNLLKIIAMVAPLLGLLGTVTGMIITFQMITLFGAGDPKAMAGGISQALITTVLGLVVAIPTVLMHTLVNGKAQRILHVLEEQSAGIVAGSVEGR